MYSNMDESQKPYVEWEKLDRKVNIEPERVSFYLTWSSERGKTNLWWWLFQCVPQWRKVDCKGHEDSFWGDRNTFYLVCGNGYMGIFFCQKSQNYTLKSGHIIVCIAYFNKIFFKDMGYGLAKLLNLSKKSIHSSWSHTKQHQTHM